MEFTVVSLVQYSYQNCRPDSFYINRYFSPCPDDLTWLVSLKRDLGGCRLTSGSDLVKIKNKMCTVLFSYHGISAFHSVLVVMIARTSARYIPTWPRDRCPFCFEQEPGNLSRRTRTDASGRLPPPILALVSIYSIMSRCDCSIRRKGMNETWTTWQCRCRYSSSTWRTSCSHLAHVSSVWSFYHLYTNRTGSSTYDPSRGHKHQHQQELTLETARTVSKITVVEGNGTPPTYTRNLEDLVVRPHKVEEARRDSHVQRITCTMSLKDKEPTANENQNARTGK